MVLEYKDAFLRDCDNGDLDNPCLLTGDIIGVYFTYLSSLCADDDRIAFVSPYESKWLTHCQPDDRKGIVEPLNLADKRLVLFSVNNSEKFDGCDDEGGTHWSTLVYDRTKNLFFHFDTLKGMNQEYAVKLYKNVKDFVGKAAPVPNTSSSKRAIKQMKKKMAAAKISDSKEVACDTEPAFQECDFVEQSNGVDCGLYVLAIAKSVTEFNRARSVKGGDWVSYVKKHVDRSVEDHFRDDVKRFVEDLKKKA